MKNICLSLLLLTTISISANNVDSLEALLNEKLADTTKVEILNRLTSLYQNIDIQKAYAYGHKTVAFAIQMGDQKWMGNSYMQLGRTCANGAQPDSAMYFFQKAMDNFKAIDNKLGIGQIHNKFAFIELYQNSNFDKALAHSFKALAIFEELEMERGISFCYNDIANTLQSQEKWAESNEWAEKAKNIAIKLDNEQEKLTALRVIATNYHYLKQYDKALIMYDTILSQLQPDNYFFLVDMYQWKGNSLKFKQFHEAALSAYSKSLELAEKINLRTYYPTLYANIGHVHLFRKDYQAAIDFTQKGVALFKEMGLRINLPENYEHLSQAYAALDQHKKALEYHQLFALTKDSLFNEDKERIMSELTTKYETEQKEKEILALEKDQALKAAEIQRSKTQTFYAIGGLLLLLALAGLLYYRFRIVNNLQKQLAQLNTNKDRLFAIISHDLRGSLSGFQNIGEILNFHIDKGNTDQVKAIGQQMDAEASSLNSLLDNLLHWSVSQMEGVKINPANVPIQPVVGEITNLFKENAATKGIELKSEIAPHLSAFADPNSVKLVLRNLLSNALKFSKSGDSISINGKQDGQFVEIEVRDTGRGIPPEKMEAIFNIDRKSSSQGTAGEQGVGLGLALCKEFVERNGGSIGLESEEGKGTVCRFRLPNTG